MSLELYKNRLKAYKVEGKEGKIEDIKKRILDNFYNNPSHEEVLINDVARDVLIVSEGQKGNMIMCKPDETANAGEYVVWNEKYYLITFKYADDRVQTNASIQKCNHNLKWINSDNQLIIRPCIEDARTLYTTGIREDNKIDIPDGMVGMQLPLDNETKQLERGDCFVFNKTKYEITFYDETTYSGILVLICSEEAIDNTTDDMVNDIADRWVKTPKGVIDRLPWLDEQEPEIPEKPDDDEPDDDEPTEPEGVISYEIIGSDSYSGDGKEIYSDESAMYTVKKFLDGAEISGTFDFTIDDESLSIIVEKGDNYCIVKAKNIMIGGKVVLAITDVDTDEIVEELNIKILGW